MLDHVSIGVSDVERSKKFYDATLKPLGYSCLHSDAGSLGYGKDAAVFWANSAKHPVPADTASGMHFCFSAPTRESVKAFYDAALKAGGKDNGKPGIREDYSANYFAAFAIDPDGYRIEAHCGKA